MPDPLLQTCLINQTQSNPASNHFTTAERSYSAQPKLRQATAVSVLLPLPPISLPVVAWVGLGTASSHCQAKLGAIGEMPGVGWWIPQGLMEIPETTQDTLLTLNQSQNNLLCI